MTLPSLVPPRDGTLRILVFGPGYGESIVFGTASSGWLVIDSLAADDGTGRTVNPALQILEDAGAEWSMLMLTHPHEDHSAGMAELANQPEPGVVACVQCFSPVLPAWDQDPELGEDPAATATLGSKEQALKALRYLWDMRLDDGRRWDPRAGDAPREFGDVELRCLWPTQAAVGAFREGRDPNTLSTALLATWQDQRFVFGADVLSPQWEEVAGVLGSELSDHVLLKVPHHGSRGALIAGMTSSNAAGGRAWALTPWDQGRRLPRFEAGEGLARLHEQNHELRLTSLPFRWPKPRMRPFEITRTDGLALREQARSKDARAVAIELPRPVHDGWIEFAVTPGHIATTYGDAAGMVRGG